MTAIFSTSGSGRHGGPDSTDARKKFTIGHTSRGKRGVAWRGVAWCGVAEVGNGEITQSIRAVSSGAISAATPLITVDPRNRA